MHASKVLDLSTIASLPGQWQAYVITSPLLQGTEDYTELLTICYLWGFAR